VKLTKGREGAYFYGGGRGRKAEREGRGREGLDHHGATKQ